MANANVGNIYRHRTFCYCGDQVGINVRYFAVAALTGAPATEQALLEKIDPLLAAVYKPGLVNSAEYIGTDMQDITGAPPYPIQVFTTANQGAGTGGAATMGSQVSGIYSTVTAKTGKKFRGRAYIPFPAAAMSTTDAPPEMTDAYQSILADIANLTTAATALIVGGSAYTLNWALCHNPQAAGAKSLDITTGYKIGVAWATQKRRGDFGRTNAFPL
jgi:hypothetical protein